MFPNVMDGGGGMGGLGGLAMGADFEAFLRQPENQKVVEQHYRSEMKKALRMEERARTVQLREAVFGCSMEAQQQLAPFLGCRVLCRVLCTFLNDENGDFEKWATNPAVIQMLRQAKQMMDRGLATEDEIENRMLRFLERPDADGYEDFREARERKMRLPAEPLAQAMNEHLQEWLAGNQAYEKGDWKEALAKYTRALAIVDLVQGENPTDQAVVMDSKATILLNMAAVYMAQGRFRDASASCTSALEAREGCPKALLRRARCFVSLGEWDRAETDLRTLLEMQPDDGAVAAEFRRMESLRKQHRKASDDMFREIFKKGG